MSGWVVGWVNVFAGEAVGESDSGGWWGGCMCGLVVEYLSG